MSSLGVEATREERAAYAVRIRTTVVERLRFVVIPGLMVVGAIAVVGHQVYGLGSSVAIAAVPGVSLLAAGAATYSPALARRVLAIYALLSVAFAATIGELAARTGGFASPFCYGVLLVWFFGAAIAGLGSRALAVYVGIQSVTMSAWIGARGAAGSPWLLIVMFGGAAAFCLLGAWLRERAELASHVAHTRLAASHEEVGALAAALKVRIDEQVAESRALDAQVRARVQERARELALALDRLHERPATVPRPGDVIGERAEIIRPLGDGGMGMVYECHDRVTERRVAVKLLRFGVSPDAMRRFVVEAAAIAAIEHPAVVRTLHLDVTPEGRLFHVMELVEGHTLERVLEHNALEPEEGAQLIAKVAEALAAAHARGIVHRDIKPSNVMITAAEPGVRVLDFGVSKVLDDSWQEGVTSRTRGLIGTPRYMAPEQREGGEVGTATDIYALGIVLEEVMTGHARRRGNADGPTPQVLVTELITILARCLAIEPVHRPTAAEVGAALEAYARRHGAPTAHRLAARLVEKVPASEPIGSARTIDSGTARSA